jgi:hypothetical protein
MDHLHKAMHAQDRAVFSRFLGILFGNLEKNQKVAVLCDHQMFLTIIALLFNQSSGIKIHKRAVLDGWIIIVASKDSWEISKGYEMDDNDDGNDVFSLPKHSVSDPINK